MPKEVTIELRGEWFAVMVGGANVYRTTDGMRAAEAAVMAREITEAVLERVSVSTSRTSDDNLDATLHAFERHYGSEAMDRMAEKAAERPVGSELLRRRYYPGAAISGGPGDAPPDYDQSKTTRIYDMREEQRMLEARLENVEKSLAIVMRTIDEDDDGHVQARLDKHDQAIAAMRETDAELSSKQHALGSELVAAREAIGKLERDIDLAQRKLGAQRGALVSHGNEHDRLRVAIKELQGVQAVKGNAEQRMLQLESVTRQLQADIKRLVDATVFNAGRQA